MEQKNSIRNKHDEITTHISAEGLGKVIVKVPWQVSKDPGSQLDSEPEWEPYTVKFENTSQMTFYKERDNSFRFNYIIYGCIIKEKKEVIWDHNLQR